MNKYLRSFVIGSSFPVFLIFFLSVAFLSKDLRNYSYKTYTFLAPLYFGLMNILSLYLAQKYNLSLKQRLFYIWILSATIVSIFETLLKSYNLDNYEWLKYYFIIFLYHFIAFNIVIYF